MPFKIRTKLFIAFIGLIMVIMMVSGFIGYYLLSTSHRALHKVEAVAEEIIVVGGLQHSLEHVLMPANDYLITGDRKYIDDFNVLSREVEERLKKSEELLGYLEALGLSHIEKEGKSLKDVKTAWQNIREISLKIFDIPDPIGNKDGARMMEEIDYRWGGPATTMLQKWHEGDIGEYKEAIELAEKARRMSWIIMASAATLLLILGAGFTAFYSKLFVGPIKKLHNGADVIAGGDFKTRLDVKTGDELEQLSNAMNEMAAQLDSLYSNLQGMVEERTKELKESEDKYRTMIESANDMIWTVDREGLFTFINTQGVKNGGYAIEELMGKHYLTVIHPEDRAMREEYFKRTLSGERTQFTVRAFGKDHEERILILQISSAPIYKEGKVVGTVNFGRDITDLRKAEEELEESERRLQLIMGNMRDAVFFYDMNRRLQFVTPAFEELTGYTAKELYEKNFINYIHSENGERMMGLWEGLFQGKAHSGVEFHIVTKDGRIKWCLSSWGPVFDEQGRQVGVQGREVDITERKKAEEELKRRFDEIKRMNRLMVDREIKMAELKKENQRLRDEAGKKVNG